MVKLDTFQTKRCYRYFLQFLADTGKGDHEYVEVCRTYFEVYVKLHKSSWEAINRFDFGKLPKIHPIFGFCLLSVHESPLSPDFQKQLDYEVGVLTTILGDRESQGAQKICTRLKKVQSLADVQALVQPLMNLAKQDDLKYPPDVSHCLILHLYMSLFVPEDDQLRGMAHLKKGVKLLADFFENPFFEKMSLTSFKYLFTCVFWRNLKKNMELREVTEFSGGHIQAVHDILTGKSKAAYEPMGLKLGGLKKVCFDESQVSSSPDIHLVYSDSIAFAMDLSFIIRHHRNFFTSHPTLYLAVRVLLKVRTFLEPHQAKLTLKDREDHLFSPHLVKHIIAFSAREPVNAIFATSLKILGQSPEVDNDQSRPSHLLDSPTLEVIQQSGDDYGKELEVWAQAIDSVVTGYEADAASFLPAFDPFFNEEGTSTHLAWRELSRAVYEGLCRGMNARTALEVKDRPKLAIFFESITRMEEVGKQKLPKIWKLFQEPMDALIHDTLAWAYCLILEKMIFSEGDFEPSMPPKICMASWHLVDAFALLSSTFENFGSLHFLPESAIQSAYSRFLARVLLIVAWYQSTSVWPIEEVRCYEYVEGHEIGDLQKDVLFPQKKDSHEIDRVYEKLFTLFQATEKPEWNKRLIAFLFADQTSGKHPAQSKKAQKKGPEKLSSHEVDARIKGAYVRLWNLVYALEQLAFYKTRLGDRQCADLETAEEALIQAGMDVTKELAHTVINQFFSAEIMDQIRQEDAFEFVDGLEQAHLLMDLLSASMPQRPFSTVFRGCFCSQISKAWLVFCLKFPDKMNYAKVNQESKELVEFCTALLHADIPQTSLTFETDGKTRLLMDPQVLVTVEELSLKIADQALALCIDVTPQFFS